MSEPRYVKPDPFTKHVFNRAVAGLTRIGVSVWGSRILTVRGRSSGLPRSTPVNLLVFDGERYLVAPRGHTQWVRNLRVAGEGELSVGRRREPFTAVEVADADKVAILRAGRTIWRLSGLTAGVRRPRRRTPAWSTPAAARSSSSAARTSAG